MAHNRTQPHTTVGTQHNTTAYNYFGAKNAIQEVCSVVGGT